PDAVRRLPHARPHGAAARPAVVLEDVRGGRAFRAGGRRVARDLPARPWIVAAAGAAAAATARSAVGPLIHCAAEHTSHSTPDDPHHETSARRDPRAPRTAGPAGRSLRRRPYAARPLLAARRRPPGADGEELRGEAPDDRRALARHGLAGRLRPRPLGGREPAGRRLVRRAAGDLRAGRGRQAARAVPAAVGGRRAGRLAQRAEPLLRRLPHRAG